MNQISKFFQRNRQAICCMGLFLMCTAVFAQTGTDVLDEMDVLNEVTNALVGIVSNAVSWLRKIIRVAAFVTFTILVFKLLKGEREAAEKIAWWVAGLALGSALLSVVQLLIK